MTTTLAPYGRITKLNEDRYSVSIIAQVNGKTKATAIGSESNEVACQVWVDWSLMIQKSHHALSAPSENMRNIFRKEEGWDYLK